MKKSLLFLPLGFFFASADFVFAQFGGRQEDAFSLIDNIILLIEGWIIPLLIAVAVLYFMYGVLTFMMASDEEQKKAAKSKILYGIIGIFVMVSVWGLVNVLMNTLGIDDTAMPARTPPVPGR